MIKTLNNLFKQDKEKFVVPKSVQAVIPMKTIWEDGIFLVGKNKYAKTFKFEDINYAVAKTALENGSGVAWANDNTEVIAFAIENPGFVVGIPSLGSADTIAPAVTKGNTTLLDWLNDEIEALGEEEFFHADYEATLLDTYGADYEDTLVVEGGVVAPAPETTEAPAGE